MLSQPKLDSRRVHGFLHRVKRRRKSVRRLLTEVLECRRLLAADVHSNGDIDPNGDEPFPDVTIAGVKWEDLNANGLRDDNEPGLPGVTIYSDLNNNGLLEDFEPITETFDDGTYILDGLDVGVHFIREVVPQGFVQTFPNLGLDPFAPYLRDGDEFSTVQPAQINLDRNEPFMGEVSLTIHPQCFRPFDIDVVSSDPDIEVINETGVLLNGCAGDTSTFQVTIFGHELGPRAFDLRFIDAEFGGVLASIPVRMIQGSDGAHIIEATHGGYFDGADFGNARTFQPGSVHGRKWQDDNGNGIQDNGEEGLAGVRIYADLNNNGAFERHEPNTITMRDDPNTEDIDEAGHYWLDGLPIGQNQIREVVPTGFAQTFPSLSSTVALWEPGRLREGVALQMDVTGATIAPDTNAPAIDLDISVVWPSTCGGIAGDLSVGTVVSDTIIVSLHGRQASDFCLPVLNTQTETVRIPGLDLREYDVVVTLNEELVDGTTHATLTGVGEIAIGGFGAHIVNLTPGTTVDGLDFGNQPTRPGSIHGLKWLDENSNGIRDPNERGLPGVTVYADLNLNRRLDDHEPHTVTMEDLNDDLIDENGIYWLEGLEPGQYVIREVVPDGFVQTFPTGFDNVEPGTTFPILGIGGHIVQLRHGERVEGIDFGNARVTPGSVHGVKWLDTNGNRVRDEGEPGLPGVTIYSDLNLNGQLDDGEPHTVTMEDFNDDLTDDNGRYWLDGLAPGTHIIREIVPDGFVQSFPEPLPFPIPGGPILVPPEFGDGAHLIRLDEGQVIDGLDFGNRRFETASVHGRKWLDLNGNGQRESNEAGIPGIRIFADLDMDGLPSEFEPQTVTMADDPSTRENEAGHYWLEGLEPGGYVIREVIPNGFRQTFPPFFGPEGTDTNGLGPNGGGWGFPIPIPPPNDEGGHWVWLEVGDRVEGLDFGNQRIDAGIEIHGRKWLDRNGNGQRDADEPGLAGVTIYVDENLNNQFDRDEPSAVTMRDNPGTLVDESGLYSIDDIEPGLVLVREVVPEGFEPTFPSFLLCEATFCVGRAHMLSLESGDVIDGLDFGNEPSRDDLGAIHGTKWNDRNGNGRRDREEPGLPGVTVYVDLNSNGRLDDHEPSTKTLRDNPITNVDEAGRYWLEGLPAGRHIVREVVPRGFEQTFPLGHGARIIDAVTLPRNPVDALSWELIDVQQVLSEDGSVGADMTFSILWPGCAVFESGTRVDGEGQIHVEAFVMHDPSAFCINPPREATHTIHVNGLSDGRHELRAELHESFPEQLAYVLEANIELGGNGSHLVGLEPGDRVEGIDFGNRSLDTKGSSLHGWKWSDYNGNGERDRDEPGLSGVVIWIDANLNGFMDANDPQTRTMRDNPKTDFDETGRYRFDDLDAGFYVIREVVPAGFEPTFPDPFFCRAIFCNGHGHMVTLEAGAHIDGLNFGNRPLHSDAGSIAGVKWLDRNGNTRRDDGEPGLPGVTIYLDLNNNGQLDRNEPSVESGFDDPNTRHSEAGHYQFDNVKPGRYVVRELLPPGMQQTFPSRGIDEVMESVSIPRDPLYVTDFHLIEADQSITDDGEVGLDLTYQLNHGPNLCAPIFDSGASVDDGGRIQVEIAAMPNPLALCANEPMVSTHTVHVPGVETGRFDIRAELFEGFGNLDQVSFVNEATVRIGGDHVGTGLVLESVSIAREPVFVDDFHLVEAGQSILDSGESSLDLTYVLDHHADLCAPYFESVAQVDDDGQIQVEITALPSDALCIDEPMESAHVVRVLGVNSGRFDVRAELYEGYSPPGTVSFVNEATVEIGLGDGSHVVFVEPGQTMNNVSFGNRRVGNGPRLAVWRGEDGNEPAHWDDAINWVVDGAATDLAPGMADATNRSDVVLAAEYPMTIRMAGEHIVNSLRFINDFHLLGGSLIVSSEDLRVDHGVVATVDLDLKGPINKRGRGTLLLADEAGDVTVTAGVFGGNATLGHLQVGPAAMLSPGMSTGRMFVSSATFEPGATLLFEISGIEGTDHDSLISHGTLELDGHLFLDLLDDFEDLEVGEKGSVTILQAGDINGQFDNSSDWTHLDGGVFYRIDYGSTEVNIELWKTLPGDINGDGAVDNTDLNTWTQNRFSHGTWVEGDVNNDLVVDGSDFNIWADHRFEVVASTRLAHSARIPRAPAVRRTKIDILPSEYIRDIPEQNPPRDFGQSIANNVNQAWNEELARQSRWLRHRRTRVSELACGSREVRKHESHDQPAWETGVDEAFSELGRRLATIG